MPGTTTPASADWRIARSGQVLGYKIAKLREKHGLSQAAVARDLGVSQSAVSQWECGAAQPSTVHLQAIAYYFRCRGIDDLVRK